MKINDSIRLTIDDFERGELESAMLHACNAVDGTAKKLYPKLHNRDRFTKLLRDNYDILGPMGMPGIDIAEMRFPIDANEFDIADVIYKIHRCTHGHGGELPEGFSLIENTAGPRQITNISICIGKSIHMSDRIIFALISIAILLPINKGMITPKLDGYYLFFGNSHELFINDWWGRKNDFLEFIAKEPMPLVKLDFSNIKT